MRRCPAGWVWLALTITLGCGAPGVRADLASEIDAILQDRVLKRATVGIEVMQLGQSDAQTREVVNLRGRSPLTPASNLKVATTSAALDHFGPDFRFRTIAVLHEGDLIIIGDGDPAFGDAEYLRRSGWKTTTVFENWAAQLKKLNVPEVRNVIVDDSVFDQGFSHPQWPARQYAARFEAEVGGMNLNTNCVDFTISPTSPGAPVTYTLDPPTTYVTVHNACITGGANKVRLERNADANDVALGGETPGRGTAAVSITVHDPPLFAATALADVLRSAGLKVSGAVKRDRTIRATQMPSAGGKWVVVGIHETPLIAVLARCNKDSMNVYAESLCKRLGFDVAHAPGSWENGPAAVGAFLVKAGAGPEEFKLEDGSGLSRGDAITPHALARVLVYDHFSPNHDTFFASLSVAGVDGTLDDRFREREVRDLRRRVFGKSGFIEGVSTLCGYLKARDDNWYVFSIMMNGIPHLSNSEVKAVQEKILHAVDRSTARP